MSKTYFEILLVEDEEDLRLTLKDNLEYEGYVVHAVTTGEEALALVEGKSFALAILDLMLPGIDGYSVCRAFRL